MKMKNKGNFLSPVFSLFDCGNISEIPKRKKEKKKQLSFDI